MIWRRISDIYGPKYFRNPIIAVINTEKLLNDSVFFLKKEIEDRRQQSKKRTLRILGKKVNENQ